MKTIAFFNNKGGVGKTTLVYHLAWMFSQEGKSVVVADYDPQANLTSMFLPEQELEKLWNPDQTDHQSIMAPLQPLIRGLGDIAEPPLREISKNLSLIPGDLSLSNFEALLSDAWSKCLEGNEPAFRTTSSLYRIATQAGTKASADLILMDVGPNFGAINRAALIGADAIVVPLAPDLFSIQGLRNLGPTLKNWRKDWKKRLEENPTTDLELPRGIMTPIGYVILQFGIKDSRPVKAYDKWSKRIPETYAEKVMDEAFNATTPNESDENCLGLIKHYRSLMPMAMEVRKPIFELKPADGAIGAHVTSVKNCRADFKQLADSIKAKIDFNLQS